MVGINQMVASHKLNVAPLLWSDLIGESEPDPGCSFNSFSFFFLFFTILLNFLFQKCRDPNGRSEPEPGLLRPFLFILSKRFIYDISF